MTRIVPIEIPVDEDAAESLKSVNRRVQVRQIVSKLARLYDGRDPLAELLEHTAARAQETGLTDEDIDAELAAYAERRG